MQHRDTIIASFVLKAVFISKKLAQTGHDRSWPLVAEVSSSAFWGIPAATANLHSDEVTGPTREDADEPGEGGITQSTFTLNGKTWHVGQSNWLPIHVINAAIYLSAMLAAMPRTPVSEAYHRLVQAERQGSDHLPHLLMQLQDSVRDVMTKQGHYLPGASGSPPARRQTLTPASWA
jgi:hypothetical protein